MLKLCPAMTAILDFRLTKKITYLDYPRNIPAMLSVKLVLRFQINIILKYVFQNDEVD